MWASIAGRDVDKDESRVRLGLKLAYQDFHILDWGLR